MKRSKFTVATFLSLAICERRASFSSYYDANKEERKASTGTSSLTLAAHARARVTVLGLCVCLYVCVCACVCLSANPCPPFFSSTAAALSFKRGYVLR